MSALGFLGGLGTTVGAMQKGYEQAEDREAMRKEREFLAGQRQRKLDEQKREDELRTSDAAVATTEEIDDPNWVAPAADPNAVAQVTINEDGTETVAAPAAPQAPKVTRKRSWDAIYGDYAQNRRKAGDIAGALKFEEQADATSFKQAAQTFQRWSATTPDDGNLYDAAQSAAKLYNSDRLPGKVAGIDQNKDGSITVRLKNSSTGQEIPRTFKSVAELKQGLEGYYSPDTYAAYIKSRREAILKANEPKVVNPGGALVAGGKEVYKNTTDRVQIGEDENGNPIYGKPAGTGRGAGTGTGSGKAPKESIDAATDLLKDFLGKADGSPESAQRQARAVSLLDGIYSGNPGVSPRTAAAIAADASADPTRVSLQIDNRTGLIGKVYKNPDLDGGRQYNLAPNGAQVAEMEKAVGKQGMVQAVNGMIESIAAGAPEENRAAVRDQFIAVASNPTARAEFLAAAKEAGRDTQALNRQLDLVKAYVSAPKANTKAPVVAQPGGLRPQAADPASPAGRAQARQAQLRAKAAAKDQQRAEAQQALSKQFQSDKNTLDPLALAQKYDSMRGQLPTADAAELQRIERNIR